METVINTLAVYGATLDGDFIARNGKKTGVKVVQKKGRLRFEMDTGGLLMSGPVKPETVQEFVEKFWYWKKIGGAS
jgi:hypothetical protein